jgi:hypothetical protein
MRSRATIGEPVSQRVWQRSLATQIATRIEEQAHRLI